MEYKKLGKTGLKVSAVGFGCGNFYSIGSAVSTFGKGNTIDEAFQILDKAWELGINYFDTANTYGGGKSEEYLGEWLKLRKIPRNKVVISTKVANPVGTGPNEGGLSRKHILDEIDKSLARLGLEYVDMYVIHQPDPNTPMLETLRALDSLVKQGKVRYIGASNISAWLMVKALWISDSHNLAQFDWIQNNFSLLFREDEREVLPMCIDQGVGYTPYSPMAGGWLTGKYQRDMYIPEGSRMTIRPEPYGAFQTATVFDKLELFHACATKKKSSMGALALRWVMNHKAVSTTIVGASKLGQLDIVSEALKVDMTPEEWKEIDVLFQIQRPENASF